VTFPTTVRLSLVAALVAVALIVATRLHVGVAGQASQAVSGAQSLAPYVATPQDVVEKMLELAGVTDRDVVYDLGCGDGRLVVTAAKKYGARGVGIDIDPERIAESRANARAAGVERLVSFRQEDALTADVSQATVVTLYLLSSSNLRLRPLLTRQLRPGARIVSHTFSMGDWEPATVETFRDANGSTRTLYLWKADGTLRP